MRATPQAWGKSRTALANTSPIHNPSFSGRRARPRLAKASKQSLFSKCHHTMSSRSLVGTAWAPEASGQISHLGEPTQAFPCCPEPRARPPVTAGKPPQASCAISLAQLCSLKATARSGLCVKSWIRGGGNRLLSEMVYESL